MAARDVKVADNSARHRFEAHLGDGIAVAVYELDDGVIRFTHTKVPHEHEGEGVGTALIRAGLAAARERGLKVVPLCRFFAAYMRKHAEEQDLLGPEGWEALELDEGERGKLSE